MAMQEERWHGSGVGQTERDQPTTKSVLPLVVLAPRGLADRKVASEFLPSSDGTDSSRLGLTSQLRPPGGGKLEGHDSPSFLASERVSSQSRAVLAAEASAPKNNDILAIQGLRGIASLLVCLYHLGNGRTVLPFIHLWISNGGSIGVHIFFVLSGFIIPFSMARAGYTLADFSRFVLKRVTRIDPPYLVTIALTLLLNYFSSLSPLFAGPHPKIDVKQLLLHVGYLAALFHTTWLIPVFWTLAVEFQYYLLLGLFFPLLFSNKPVVRSASVLCFFVGAFVESRGWFIGPYLALFLAGIVLCQIKLYQLVRYELVVYPTAALAVAFLKVGWPAVVVAVFTCLMIAFVKTCPAALIGLGDISYSLYLVHWPIGTRVMNLGDRFPHGALQVDLLLLLGTALSVAASCLMYKWIELPAKHLAARITYKDGWFGRAKRL